MTKEAYEKVAEGLEEALEVARGKATPASTAAVLNLKDGTEIVARHWSDGHWTGRCPSDPMLIGCGMSLEDMLADIEANHRVISECDEIWDSLQHEES